MTKKRIVNRSKKRGSAIATKKKSAPPRATHSKRAARPKRATPPKKSPILGLVQKSLDDDKAQNIVVIDLVGKSSLTDFMVIATGTSTRHVAAMAEHLRDRIKAKGFATPPVEGLSQSDWVLIDAGDVVVHLFRAEVRRFYNLEKMWSGLFPESGEERIAL